jgi:hypothetical protein
MKRILRKLLPVGVKDYLYRTNAKLKAKKLKQKIPALQIRKNTSDLKVFEDICCQKRIRQNVEF